MEQRNHNKVSSEFRSFFALSFLSFFQQMGNVLYVVRCVPSANAINYWRGASANRRFPFATIDTNSAGKILIEEFRAFKSDPRRENLKISFKTIKFIFLIYSFSQTSINFSKQFRFLLVNIPLTNHMLSALRSSRLSRLSKKNPSNEQVNIPSRVCYCTQSAADFQAINIKNDVSLAFW